MLIKRGEHKLAGTKCLGNMHVYSVENNFSESTGTCSTWLGFLESQCSELFNMLCKIKDKVLLLVSHVINKEAQHKRASSGLGGNDVILRYAAPIHSLDELKFWQLRVGPKESVGSAPCPGCCADSSDTQFP